MAAHSPLLLQTSVMEVCNYVIPVVGMNFFRKTSLHVVEISNYPNLVPDE